jgi:hypothetical protein
LQPEQTDHRLQIGSIACARLIEAGEAKKSTLFLHGCGGPLRAENFATPSLSRSSWKRRLRFIDLTSIR